MKRILISSLFCAALATGLEAAPQDAVTKADLDALRELILRQNAQIEAQSRRIAELEGKLTAETAAAKPAQTPPPAAPVPGEGTTTNETGKIWTLASGEKFYLADATAGIFQPLTQSGFQFQPYGYLMFEGVYNTSYTDLPMFTDWVRPRGNGSKNGGHTATLSVHDSIMGFNLTVPEPYMGWKMGGKFEFDLAGNNANSSSFRMRHLYWNMEHETGWSILFGQTWHLWKMVTPQEIDSAWMENAGHPYRRSPQLRVTRRWNWEDSSLEVRAGIVKNGLGMGGDRDRDGVQDNEQSAWALLEGAIVYDRKAFWEDGDRRWLLGVAGQYGRDRSRRMDPVTALYTGPNDEYDSDMIMVAGKLPLSIKNVGLFTFTGQLFAGENLGGVQAGIGQTVGFTDPTRKGREVSTVGGFADLRWDLPNDSKWAFAIGYGFDDPTDSEAINAGGRTFNDRAYIDAFYQFNANLHFGFEYAYLTTEYARQLWNHVADDHRFQFTVYYDF